MTAPGSIISPVLLGRTGEMESLDHALRATQGGAGGCIMLAGEAGIGKSRLANELSDHATSSHFLILKGYCSEQDGSFPYAPWIDALRAFLGWHSLGDVGELLGVFAPELVKLLPELSLLIPYIHPTPLLEPIAEKHRLFEVISRFIVAFAESHPLLIILEDLHWSDEQSLELLSFLVRRIYTVPILILGTYRSDIQSPHLVYHLAELTRTHLMKEIQLAPLTRTDVGRMAGAILKIENLISSDKLDLLMTLTEGNPFFVEEMTKSLIQAGISTGQWSFLHFPPSIQHLVQHRVEKLPERTRHVLSLASVIGERIDFALLQEAAGEDEQSLLQILKELIASQLIVEQTADQYKFRHALTREVVYRSLMLRERKSMHKTIGETIDRFIEKHMDTPAAVLAYHFYQAGEWQKAMEYSQRAGEEAQALYAPREALTHFSHTLEAARHLNIPTPPASLRGRGQARSILGDFDGARADYDTLIEMARHSGDRNSVWQALIELGYIWQLRDLVQAGEYFQQALQLARTMGDATVLGQSLNQQGNWYFFRGQPHEALLMHNEALQIFQQRGDRRGTAKTLELLGMASYGVGDVIQGVAYYERAIPLLQEVDNRQGLVRALEFLSLRARFDTEVLGEVFLSQLASYSEQAFEIAHNFDWREGEGEALSRAAVCWNRAGEYVRSYELLLRAQRIGEEIEHRHLLTSVHFILGEWYLDLLTLDQARDNLELAFTLAKKVGAFQLLKSIPPALVRTCVLQNDLSRAKEVMAALEITEDTGEIERAGMFERLCWSAQVELDLALDHSERALETVDRMIASAQNLAKYGPFAIPWLSQLRAQALASLGRSEEAVDCLLGAQAIARNRGARPLLWRLHSDLGKVYHTLSRRQEAEQEFSSARAIIQDLAMNLPEGPLRQNFLHQALAIIPAIHLLTRRQEMKREFGGLTAREREIARLIASGMSNREIANELVISEKTVERHIANIMAKLRFNARTQIAAWVVAKKLNR